MDSLIVYRNPLEKMFWEGGYKGAAIFAVAFFVVFMLSYWSIEKVRLANSHKWRTPNWVLATSLALGFVAGVIALIFMP